MAINRDLYFSQIQFGDDADGLEGHWLRLPYQADYGQFFGEEKFAIIDRVQGKIVIVNTPPPFTAGFTDTLPDVPYIIVEPVTSEDYPHRFQTYHRGSCVGRPVGLDRGSYTLPTGEEIDLDERDRVLVKTDSGAYTIQFPEYFDCVQFSRDWRLLLAINSYGDFVGGHVYVYDFAVARLKKSFDEALLGRSPADNLTSAFFVGPQADIITAAWDGRVIRWSRTTGGNQWLGTELYQGNLPLIYAEPDRDGNRLLLIEYPGGGDITASLYSLRAQIQITKLGTGYKWIGVAFTEDSRIGTLLTARGPKLVALSNFPTLLNDAESALSPDCRPISPGDYRTSPCWPSDSVLTQIHRD